MRIKKAFWASVALIPATIVPLAAATSCSQAWGYKTPISIGTNIKGDKLDPFKNFRDIKDLVDLNGDSIVDYLQSNYSIDTKSNNFYGYSLPQKWDSTIQYTDPEGKITWDKGDFTDGSVGWYDYSSGDFVKSATRTGKRGTTNVSEAVYSYRNNTLSSNIQLVGTIASTISSYFNYALQYQGTQIGTKYSADASGFENDSNLAISWGGNLTHGAIGSEENRKFYESIYAANAVSGTSKSTAALHPTHIEFDFRQFPIVAYAKEDGKITGVNDWTLALLNKISKRPVELTSESRYWSNVQEKIEEVTYDIKTGDKQENTYNLYTFTNVPVCVSFNSFTKAYVNPQITNSFIVNDFYSEKQAITNTVGNSWTNSLSNFAKYGSEVPTYSRFTFNTNESKKGITPLAASDSAYDLRLESLDGTEFVVLVNYAYKEYTKFAGTTVANHDSSHDRVTMTGLSSVFPCYFIDKDLKLGKETTFFKLANNKEHSGYIIDSDKTNRYNNLFFELMKRNAGQGLVTEAKNLNDTSKQLLMFLAYMFGNDQLKVNLATQIETDKL